MAEYHVAKTGSDSNNGTSLALAKLTMNAGVALLSAGDTLWVHAGTYDEYLWWNIPSGTSWANKVRIAAWGADSGPSRDVVWMIPTTIVGNAVIDFAGSGGGGTTGGQAYIEVDGINTSLVGCTEVGTNNIKIESGSTWNANHIRIQHSEHIGSKIASGSAFTGVGGILLTETTAGAFVGFNELINLSMHSGGNATTVCVSLYIQSDDNLVDGMEIYDLNDGMQLNNATGGDPPSRNVIRNSRVHHLNPWNDGRIYGIIIQGTDNDVYNNIFDSFTDSIARGIYLWDSTTSEIYNNTVYGIGGIGFLIDSGNTATVRNNIVYNCSTNFSDSGTGTRSNNITDGTNPVFVDAANGDFRIQTSSPAKDTGFTVAMVTTDILGITRPQNSTYDIGAHEFLTAGVTTLSANPTSGPTGTTYTLTWTNIPSATSTDWIGFYLAGSPPVAILEWFYVSGTKTPGSPLTNGSISFPTPISAPGSYEFRLYPNDNTLLLLATASVTVTVTVPVVGPELLTYRLELFLNGSWTDVTADVRTQHGIVCEYGIQGSDVYDRVASAGSLAWYLDNRAKPGALLGRYSPMHPNKRPGFTFNIPARFVFEYFEITKYKFSGSLAEIIPTPGVHEERDVFCQALDWMDDAARIDMPDLDAQVGKRGDELITMILNAMTTQPVARSISTGVDTFAWALDGGTGQRLKVRERLQQICMSEFGHCFIEGDSTQGGTFSFRNRNSRLVSQSVATVTLSDDEIDRSGGLVVPGSRDEMYSAVQVFAYPTTVDAAATTVLYSLQTTSTLISPGETNNTLFGPYRDPDTNDQVGGTAMVTPVATTDYLMNSLEDGSGSDLTADFTVTASATGEGVRWTITNNGATAGYVTFLQIRGKMIRRSEVMVEEVVAGSYGDRVLTFDMPFQHDTNVAQSVAEFVAGVYAAPLARVPSVRFRATKSDALIRAALLIEPGMTIGLSETVTGLNNNFVVQSVRLELEGTGQLWCTWGLEPAISTGQWELGVSTLGVGTILGF